MSDTIVELRPAADTPPAPPPRNALTRISTYGVGVSIGRGPVTVPVVLPDEGRPGFVFPDNVNMMARGAGR